MRQSWSRQDALVALAAYLDRPAGRRLPPCAETQRVANILGVGVERVHGAMRAFAALDPENALRDADVGVCEQCVWAAYRDRPERLWSDADAVVQDRRLRPHPLWRRGD